MTGRFVRDATPEIIHSINRKSQKNVLTQPSGIPEHIHIIKKPENLPIPDVSIQETETAELPGDLETTSLETQSVEVPSVKALSVKAESIETTYVDTESVDTEPVSTDSVASSQSNEINLPPLFGDQSALYQEIKILTPR